MAKNISNRIVGVRKQYAYQGDSSFKIWLNENELIKVQTNYDDFHFKHYTGTSHLTRLFHGAKSKYFDRYLTDQLINKDLDL